MGASRLLECIGEASEISSGMMHHFSRVATAVN